MNIKFIIIVAFTVSFFYFGNKYPDMSLAVLFIISALIGLAQIIVFAGQIEIDITEDGISRTKFYSFLCFGIGMVLMFNYIPRFESLFVNFVIGAACGGGGALIGLGVGHLLDKKLETEKS